VVVVVVLLLLIIRMTSIMVTELLSASVVEFALTLSCEWEFNFAESRYIFSSVFRFYQKQLLSVI
jgi:hypothetical protein